jgi:hypothetical protein
MCEFSVIDLHSLVRGYPETRAISCYDSQQQSPLAQWLILGADETLEYFVLSNSDIQYDTWNNLWID